MITLTISLPEDRLKQIERLAQQAGLTPEELARVTLEEWLARHDDEFTKAADYVFLKNAELYKRLA